VAHFGHRRLAEISQKPETVGRRFHLREKELIAK
jgi:hypothetical protein